MEVGIESLNAFACAAVVEVKDIFRARGLNLQRFDNLLMHEKSVSLPCEDPVTNAVNAAKPLIDSMTEEQRSCIDMVITASESGIDFGKSISTYVHHYLGLDRHCKLFEIKQACFGGTVALGLACSHVLASPLPDPKVLIIATDVARSAEKITYAEPSQGGGAVAFVVGRTPRVLELDFGASGSYSYEVMDTCRPHYDVETGDPDLSLFSYLDCLEQCFTAYSDRVDGVDVVDTFDFLAFHTPFGGMVKGAHRKLMRRFASLDNAAIGADFSARMAPGLDYCMRVGNLYSASLYLALASLIENAEIPAARRVGLFSYGSGCSSEFFSGLITPASKQALRTMRLREMLDRRYRLDFAEYEAVLDAGKHLLFGAKDLDVDRAPFSAIYQHYFEGRGLLVLEQVRDYHRRYAWS